MGRRRRRRRRGSKIPSTTVFEREVRVAEGQHITAYRLGVFSELGGSLRIDTRVFGGYYWSTSLVSCTAFLWGGGHF